MLETSARLLRLLSLLQSRRIWQGPELARELEVTERTVRRDMEKLRSLGYPVQATAGVAGGYRLSAGARLPPLLLDDGEALAVAFGLRSAAVGSVAGMEQAALRALDKLGKVMPERLRRRVSALNEAFVAAPFRGPQADPDTLTQLVTACEERRLSRFAYEDGKGQRSERAVEALGVVHTLARWYLVCWDRMRSDFRTFRVDRITQLVLDTERFRPRSLPDGDLASYVSRAIQGNSRPIQATVELLAPLSEVRACLPPSAGTLTALDESRCLLRAGEYSYSHLAFYLGTMEVEFIVHEPPELIEAMARWSGRMQRALQASVAPPPLDPQVG